MTCKCLLYDFVLCHDLLWGISQVLTSSFNRDLSFTVPLTQETSGQEFEFPHP